METDKDFVLFTIGFTQKTADRFFSLLIGTGVRCIIDIRLNNVSQLAGFTKRDDLRYFLKTIAGIDYLHLPQLAPTKELLTAFKKKGGNWDTYKQAFQSLLLQRAPEKLLSPAQIHMGCLLCSEAEPECCHRSIVADYFEARIDGLTVVHL